MSGAAEPVIVALNLNAQTISACVLGIQRRIDDGNSPREYLSVLAEVAEELRVLAAAIEVATS